MELYKKKIKKYIEIRKIKNFSIDKQTDEKVTAKHYQFLFFNKTYSHFHEKIDSIPNENKASSIVNLTYNRLSVTQTFIII